MNQISDMLADKRVMPLIRYDEEVKDHVTDYFFKLALRVLFPLYFLFHLYDRMVVPDKAWVFLGIRLTILPVILFFWAIFKGKWRGYWHLGFVWGSTGLISGHMALMSALSGGSLIYLQSALMMGGVFLIIFPLAGWQNLVTGIMALIPYMICLMDPSLPFQNRVLMASQACAVTGLFFLAAFSFDRIRLRGFRQKSNLFMLATTDSLTGLKLRRYFFNRFIQEISLQFRKQEDLFLSVAMFDIDSFKAINDRYGHQAGDRCIRHVGEIIQRSIRIYDVPCRFGGEEFVILFPAAQISDAAMVCERIRKTVENSPILIGSRELKLHISAGVSGIRLPIPLGIRQDCLKEASLQKTFLVKCMMRVIKEADDALYQAKKNDKNQVVTGRPAEVISDIHPEEIPVIKQYLVYFEQQTQIFDDADEAGKKELDRDMFFYPPEFFFRRCTEGVYRQYRDPAWSETLAMIRFKNADPKLLKAQVGRFFRLADVISMLEEDLVGVIFVGLKPESLAVIGERISMNISSVRGSEKVQVRISAAELRFKRGDFSPARLSEIRHEYFVRETEKIFSALKTHRFKHGESNYFIKE